MKTPHFIKCIGYMYELNKRNFKSYFKKVQIPRSEEIINNSVHWVGHATVIVNIEGKLIVTDPVTSISLGHLKRQVKPSNKLSLLHFDYILLSHGHMDHLDYNTLRKLNKDAIILCPKNYSFSLKLLGFKKVHEIKPGESYKDEDIEIETIEAKHDARRYYLGKQVMSNAYLMKRENKRVFFAGDTAYTDNFKGLEADIALMPVGCYTPDEFREMHCSPEECYKMYKAMKVPYLIPIHYKTYILSQDDESITSEKIKKFKESDSSVLNIEIGQTVKF